MTMKKNAALIAAGLLLIGGTGGFLFWDNAYNFTGNQKTVNRDSYYADFDSFNGEDVFEVDMNKGDKIHIDAHGDKGKLKLSFVPAGVSLMNASACARMKSNSVKSSNMPILRASSAEM